MTTSSGMEWQLLQSEISRFDRLNKHLSGLASLIKSIDDLKVKKSIKQHLTGIEDCLENNSEWTLPDTVSKIRLVVTSKDSSYSEKLRLIHTFVKCHNSQDKEVKGDRTRYKKIFTTEGKTYMLLIKIGKDSPPDEDLSCWMDALIYVYNIRDVYKLDNFTEYVNTINRHKQGRSENNYNIPVVLVGAFDPIESSSSSASACRVVEDSYAKKLADEVGNCSHFEIKTTSSTHVEKAFSDAVIKSVKWKQYRLLSSLPASSNTASPAVVRRSNSMSQIKPNKRWIKKAKDTPVGEIGVGRNIPEKEGYLYKRSGGLDKKKKKYAVVGDGCLTYFPSFQDYQNDSHGKSIYLQNVCVKVKQQGKSSNSKPSVASAAGTGSNNNTSAESGSNALSKGELKSNNDSAIGALIMSNSKVLVGEDGLPYVSGTTTPVSVRKKRSKLSNKMNDGNAAGDDEDGYTFTIVSSNEQSWQFEVKTVTERDEWISSIQAQIKLSLQNAPSRKNTTEDIHRDASVIVILRSIGGNSKCVDCGSENPEWASVNLGALMCIECSGIHRNLGAHISKVRSLTLDSWPHSSMSVMTSIGNNVVNKIWEANISPNRKPEPNSSRDDKEKFIRAKYEQKSFLAPSSDTKLSLSMQLMKAITKNELHNFLCVIANCTIEDINKKYASTDRRTALHLSCALSNPVIAQLLIWNNIDVTLQDSNGYTAFDYARAANSSDCMETLTNNGCPDGTTAKKVLYLTKELHVTDKDVTQSVGDRERAHSSVV